MRSRPKKKRSYSEWKNVRVRKGDNMKKVLVIILLVIFSACSPKEEPNLQATVDAFIKQTQDTMPTLAPIETVTPTEEAETNINETEVEDSTAITSNPCENLGDKYEHDEGLGEIKEDYIGSWHASPFVGSGYNERFVFFLSGNYLFFPSQYECDFDDTTCVPSPVEGGIWGVQGSQINLAKDGDINNVRSILIGEVIDSPADESPYSLKTTFDGTTYWLMTKDTNMWNPETGELCD